MHRLYLTTVCLADNYGMVLSGICMGYICAMDKLGQRGAWHRASVENRVRRMRPRPSTRTRCPTQPPRGRLDVEPLSATEEMTTVVAEMMKMVRPMPRTGRPSWPLRGRVDVEPL